jgi:hypothetical protein
MVDVFDDLLGGHPELSLRKAAASAKAVEAAATSDGFIPRDDIFSGQRDRT